MPLNTRTARRTAQAGIAAVLLLVILVMGSLYALLSGVNTATAELQQKRDDATTAALKQAKEALIARAAMDANRPGSLPCPDLVTNIAGNVPNDGVADLLAGPNCPSYIGRLPWRTLGLPDLRDSSGERLWYALSASFRDENTAVINSDTQGDLTVQGVSPMANVVAIVFAPGAAVGSQNRGVANVNDVTQYLEAENAGGVATTYVTARRCERAFDAADPAPCLLGPFNDQLLAITHADLFNMVENVVAKRLATEIAPLLRFYRDRWGALLGGPGFYPFGVPFMNPGAPGGPPSPDLFCGALGTAAGLLPVSQAGGCISINPGPPVVIDTGTGSGTVDAGTVCGLAPANQPDNARMLAVVCTINYTGGALGGTPNVQIPFTAQQAAMTLAVPIQAAEIRHGLFPAYGPSAWTGVTITQGFDPSTGNLNFQYSGTLPAVPPASSSSVTITFPLYSAQSRFLLPPNNVDTAWFFANEWYRNTYYAAVPQRLPGGVGNCTPGTNCLTVLPVANNDKQVVLVLSGRGISGIARPTAILADYFEGENDEVAGPTPGSFARQLRSSAFNDKVAVVECSPGPGVCP